MVAIIDPSRFDDNFKIFVSRAFHALLNQSDLIDDSTKCTKVDRFQKLRIMDNSIKQEVQREKVGRQ